MTEDSTDAVYHRDDEQTSDISIMIASGMMICIILGFVLVLLEQLIIFTQSINADWLYVFELANNFRENASLAGQDVPTAPYFFPDMMIFWILSVATSNPTIANIAYYVGFSGGAIVITFVILTSCGVPKRLAWLASCLAILTFGVLPPFNPASPAYFPIYLKNYPASHLTAAIVSLGALAIYLRVRLVRLGWLSFVAGFIVGCLLYSSDMILFNYLVCPLIAVSALDFFKKQLSLRSISQIVFVTLLAFTFNLMFRPLVYKWLGITSSTPFLFNPQITTTELQANFSAFMVALQRASFALPTFYLETLFFQIVGLVAIAVSFLHSMRDRSEHRHEQNFRRIAAFFFVAQAASLVSGVALNVLSNPDLFRYLIPYYFFPVIFFYLSVARAFASFSPARVLTMILMICIPAGNLLVLGLVNSDRFSSISFDPPYPDQVRCLDIEASKLGINSGLTTYWDARPIRMLSRHKIHVGQIDNEFDINFLTDNLLSIFRPDGSIRHFQFVLAEGVGGIKTSAVISKIGEPDSTIQCAPSQDLGGARMRAGPIIMVYNSAPASVALNAYVEQRAVASIRRKQRVYPVGSTIDFSIGGSAGVYMNQGWAALEQGGAWTIGREASLTMTLEGADPSSDLRLDIDATAFIVPARPTQKVAVLINGVNIGDWTFTSGSDKEHSAIIPAALRHGSNQLEILFQINDARSPSELLGVPSDARKLGISVSSARLNIAKN